MSWGGSSGSCWTAPLPGPRLEGERRSPARGKSPQISHMARSRHTRANPFQDGFGVPILFAGIIRTIHYTWTVSHEMNHREPPHLPAGVRRALRCLSLLLVPAMTLDEGLAGPRLRSTIRPTADSTPYLPVLGSPSLRVEEALPPPDLVTRPAAAAPPVPALTPAESSVAVANADAARSTAVAPDDATPVDVKPAAGPSTPAPAVKTPAPILPDSAHPVVHAEDFLPYFQVPGSARPQGDVNVFVPGAISAPAQPSLPPSTATYTQSPK